MWEKFAAHPSTHRSRITWYGACAVAADALSMVYTGHVRTQLKNG